MNLSLRKPLALFTILVTGLASTSLVATTLPPCAGPDAPAIAGLQLSAQPICLLEEDGPLLEPANDTDPMGFEGPPAAVLSGADQRRPTRDGGLRPGQVRAAEQRTPAVDLAPKHDPPPHPVDLV